MLKSLRKQRKYTHKSIATFKKKVKYFNCGADLNICLWITCTPAPAGFQLGPNPEASGPAWFGSASAAFGAWGTPAAPEGEQLLNSPARVLKVPLGSEGEQETGGHWELGWGASVHLLDCHYLDLQKTRKPTLNDLIVIALIIFPKISNFRSSVLSYQCCLFFHLLFSLQKCKNP